MNKYQEALSFLKSDNVTAWGNENIELLRNNLEIIQKLVEKEMPKKVLPLREKEYGYEHQCPVCKRFVGTIIEDGVEYDDYCCSCGQKLDWSDEYE